MGERVEVPAREFNRYPGSYLCRVEDDDVELIVTRRGKPVFRVTRATTDS